MKRWAALIFYWYCAIASAEEHEPPTLSDRKSLFATALGFGIAADYSPKLSSKARTGSNIALDVWIDMTPDLSFGLRTLAYGSQQSASPYQRLASGLLLSVQLPWELRASVSHGPYSESGTLMISDSYTSSGLMTSVSLQRPIFTSTAWQINTLTHWSSFSGTIEPQIATVPGRMAKGRLNSGTARGIALSLEIPVPQ
jgi:hypothetical protein